MKIYLFISVLLILNCNKDQVKLEKIESIQYPKIFLGNIEILTNDHSFLLRKKFKFELEKKGFHVINQHPSQDDFVNRDRYPLNTDSRYYTIEATMLEKEDIEWKVNIWQNSDSILRMIFYGKKREDVIEKSALEIYNFSKKESNDDLR
jgi:hypothetical protein